MCVIAYKDYEVGLLSDEATGRVGRHAYSNKPS